MKIRLIRILIVLIYGAVFFLTAYLDNTVNYLDLALFVLGIVLGMLLMFLDENFFYRYYLELPDNFKTDSTLDKANLKLTTRSLLFMVSLFPLGLFIVTSTGSKLGMGLFLGIITILLLELIEYKKEIDLFHKRFMSQLKKTLNIKEVNMFVIGFGTIMLFFTLLIFFSGR